MKEKIDQTINSLCDLISQLSEKGGLCELNGIAEITKALAELIRART